MYLSNRLCCYIEQTIVYFDRSYIHWTNSCIWNLWNTINESKESKNLRRFEVPMSGSRITKLGLEEPEDDTCVI